MLMKLCTPSAARPRNSNEHAMHAGLRVIEPWLKYRYISSTTFKLKVETEVEKPEEAESATSGITMIEKH